MRKFYRILLAAAFIVSGTIAVNAQNGVWSAHENTGNVVIDKVAARTSFPKEFKLFNLNLQTLKSQLFTVAGSSVRESVIISLPNAAGEYERFEMYEASNFEPALQARFPEIRAFSGRGITDKFANVKLSISPSGIQTMVFRAGKEAEFIEAYSADHSVYAVFKSQRVKGEIPWRCFTPEADMVNGLDARVNESNFIESSAGELKVIRLAQSVTGEYSNFFGASTAGTPADQAIVLTAVNNTITRCNGVYEKDLALHCNLIANTTAVFYYNPATDPYATVTNAGQPPTSWNSSLQSTLTSVIGEANYDIGHLFGASGGGGNAGCIGCVCNNGSKGSGITSPATGSVNPSTSFPPAGDNFDIDYVVHEIGHQLGAFHTFSFDAAQIGAASVEVGSGITIMAYAGIVSGANVAAHSVDYYHAFSINQIQVNLATKTCPVTTNISANNATPVVGALTPYTIPMSTPFALTGTATDANAGDGLTYAWEQNDAATATSTGTNSLASPTKLTGPNFADFPVRTDGVRLFPRLQSILTGASTTSGTINGGDNVNIEALSSVARTLNFRLTVRDNSPYVASGAGIKVGQTSFGDVAITVSAAVGPFLISSQNTAVTYNAGTTQTVTWNVANTTGAPTNTANVKISWSTDGGNNFTTLIASTANDGTETFTVPSTLTTTARIKVEAIGNIYFDINNASITVSTPPVGYTLGGPGNVNVACASGTTATATITSASQGGFTNQITLTVSGAPTGTTATINPASIAPGASSTLTLTGVNTLAAGTYNVTVTGNATGGGTQTVVVPFVVQASNPTIGTQPANQAVCAGQSATFTVAATGPGLTYQWQVAQAATPTTFVNISGAVSASYNTGAVTVAMSGNVYRVIVTGQCGATTSNSATLTVNTAASITSQPTAVTVCSGTSASFTVGVAGTGALVQWQSGPSATGPFTNIPGATNATYTIASTTPAQNGTYYRAVVTTTTCAGSVNSNAVLLTVNTTAAITAQPTDQSACVPATATFTVSAVGTGLGYQWQVSTNGTTFTDIAGATSATYTTPPVTFAMNGYKYRVLVSSTCSPGNPTVSNAVTLTVNNPVTITQNPLPQSGCLGDNFTFSVTASSGGSVTYQWQVSYDNGVTYTNIAGATNSTYTVTNAQPYQNGALYRVIVSGVPCGQVITPGASLAVSPKPQVVLTAQYRTTLNPSLPSGLFTTVSPPGNYIYRWERNGQVVPNTLGSSFLPITVDDFGTYRVTVVTVGTNCSATSNTVVIDSNVSNRLFIYPNPVITTMQVRYYSSTTANRDMMLNVYDGKGARVYGAKYTVSGTYGRMDVDLSGVTRGIYFVEIRDASGKKLAGGTVMKQ